MIYDSVRYLVQSLAFVLIVVSLFPSGANAEDITTFTDSSSAAGLSDIGKLGEPAVWGDYNVDGWQDLLLSNTDPDIPRRLSRNQRHESRWIKTQKTFFFKNNGGEGFEEVSSLSGLPDIKLRAATWADFNNDGFPDLALATVRASSSVKLYENSEGLHFTDVSDSAGITVDGSTANHVLWVDFNSDGFVDLFQPSLGVSYLYKNNGDGTFDEVSSKAGIGYEMYTNGAVWFDADNDGFADLFLANGNFNKFFLNNGDGTFSDVSESAGLEGGPEWRTTSACTGDYNGDGYLDLYITNIGRARRNALYRNNGDRTFTDVTWETGTDDVGDGRTCAWVDFDADGRLDLFTTNHIPPNKLFRNRPDGSFEDVASQAGINNPVDIFGATWADYDRDGFLDVYLNGHIGSALMRNNGNKNHSVTLKLIGDGIKSNRSAIGSRVVLKAGGETQIREVSGGRGCCEQDMLPVYFGLGENTTADIEVKWPSGKKCEFKDVSVAEAREYIVREPKCRMDPIEKSS